MHLNSGKDSTMWLKCGIRYVDSGFVVMGVISGSTNKGKSAKGVSLH